MHFAPERELCAKVFSAMHHVLYIHTEGIIHDFQGLVFSKGYHGHSECVYVKSGSNIIGGVDFDVFYDKCGTKVG